ncbi:MAG: 6-phosphofructokinase [Pseudomonadota bacterium]
MRVGIVTSGGDSPGMNAAIWQLERAARDHGFDAIGVRAGYQGLHEGNARPIDPVIAGQFARRGGTWLGTSRFPDLPARVDGLCRAMASLELSALVVLGGNGSLSGAALLAQRAPIPIVGIPATIDNDVGLTDLSLGFDTAVAYGLDAADRLRDTADALPRLCAIETLGGPSGHLANAVGRLSGAAAILIPEERPDIDAAIDTVGAALREGTHALVVAGEGVANINDVLGEIADGVATRLRLVRLGHAQRGGAPSPRDRAVAIASATEAIAAVGRGQSGIVAIAQGAVTRKAFADHRDAAAPTPSTVWRGLL